MDPIYRQSHAVTSIVRLTEAEMFATFQSLTQSITDLRRELETQGRYSDPEARAFKLRTLSALTAARIALTDAA